MSDFKHIMKDGESKLVSLGDAVMFYLWERIPRGDWQERFWGFELFAQTPDGETANGFVVRTTFGPNYHSSIPEQKLETFKDLDDASRWVNDQVSQKMGWGYRTVRLPAPGNGTTEK